ncbi:hypothetical protein ACFVY9_01515 [Streptomyces sp. NPDC059544]|uniref:hypothetical protein n=1 Tax=Streptomyces sp. NPDC059544 TaxID=3346861 RepID=UPI0036A6EB28
MRMRLHGTELECLQLAHQLAQVLEVLDTSPLYPDRPPSRLVRLYLTVIPPARSPQTTKED